MGFIKLILLIPFNHYFLHTFVLLIFNLPRFQHRRKILQTSYRSHIRSMFDLSRITATFSFIDRKSWEVFRVYQSTYGWTQFLWIVFVFIWLSDLATFSFGADVLVLSRWTRDGLRRCHDVGDWAFVISNRWFTWWFGWWDLKGISWIVWGFVSSFFLIPSTRFAHFFLIPSTRLAHFFLILLATLVGLGIG